MSLAISDQYMVLIGVTLLFTVFAIASHTVITHLLAALCWFASTFANMALSQQGTLLQTTLSYLFIGFGLIFAFSTLQQTYDLITERKERRWSTTL